MFWKKKILKLEDTISDLKWSLEQYKNFYEEHINDTFVPKQKYLDIMKDLDDSKKKILSLSEKLSIYEKQCSIDNVSDLSVNDKIKILTDLKIHELKEENEKQRHMIFMLQTTYNSLYMHNVMLCNNNSIINCQYPFLR